MVTRNQYYDIFTKAVLEEIKHVTDAIEEYRQNPFIEWTAVEWQRPQNGEAQATSMIVYGRETLDGSIRTIYGIVSLEVVAQGSKQAVLDYLRQVMAEQEDNDDKDEPDLSLLEFADPKLKPTVH